MTNESGPLPGREHRWRYLTDLLPPPLAQLNVRSASLFSPRSNDPAIVWGRNEHRDTAGYRAFETTTPDGARLVTTHDDPVDATTRATLETIAVELERRYLADTARRDGAEWRPHGSVEALPSLDNLAVRASAPLVNVARAMAASTTLDEMLRVVAEQIAIAANVSTSGILLYDGEHSVSEHDSRHLYQSRPDDVTMVDALPARALEALVARERRPFMYYNIDEFVTPLPSGELIHAGMILPLISGDRLRGVAYVSEARRHKRFTAEEIASVVDVVALATMALEHARIAEASRRTTQQVTILNEIAVATTQSLDLGEIFSVAATSARRLLSFDLATLAIIAADDGVEIMTNDRGRDETRLMTNGALAGWIHGLACCREIATRDVEDTVVRGMLEQADVHRSVFGRLVADGQTLGLFGFSRGHEQPFTREDIEFIEHVVSLVAVAVRNTTLFNAVSLARHQAEKRADQLSALQRVVERLTSQADLDQTLAVIGDELERLLPFHSCQVWELTPDASQLVAIQMWGQPGNIRPRPVLAADHGIIGDVVASGEPTLARDATLDPRSKYPPAFDTLLAEMLDQGESLMAAPLIANGVAIGGLLISQIGRGLYSEDDFQLFVNFARHVGLAVQSARLAQENRELFLSTLRTLANLVDQREHGGRSHGDRVAFLSEAVAIEMGLPAQEVDVIRLAAFVHDVGKIGVPEELLVASGALSDEERALLMTHPALGATMAGAHDAHAALAPMIRSHHEWHNGQGYPSGLSGDEIPVGAAIISVAETFDSIIGDLPYRPARSVEQARAVILEGSGTQFRPSIVEATLRVLDGLKRAGSPFLRRPMTGDLAQDRPWRTLAELHRLGSNPPDAYRILHEIANEIGALPEMTRFLRQIAQIIGVEMQLGGCAIFLLEQGTGRLALAASYPQVDEAARRTLDDSPLAAALLREEPLSLGLSWTTGSSQCAAALVADGEPIGAIVLDAREGRGFRDNDRRVLSAIAGQIATAVKVAQQHDTARQGSITDGMTGAYNYRFLIERLDTALARSVERNEPLSLLLLDMDGLKQVNDLHGHLAGDELLRAVAGRLAHGVRRNDIVARYGGDEFVVLMPQTPSAEAGTIAERLAEQLDDLPEAALLLGAERQRVASWGVSSSPEDGVTAAALLAAADARMYDMKRTRRVSRDDTPGDR